MMMMMMMMMGERTRIEDIWKILDIDDMVRRSVAISSSSTVADVSRFNIARPLQGPSLKWHKEYSDLDQQAGRVLMIDFAGSGMYSLASSRPKPVSFLA